MQPELWLIFMGAAFVDQFRWKTNRNAVDSRFKIPPLQVLSQCSDGFQEFGPTAAGGKQTLKDLSANSCSCLRSL